MRVYRWSGPTFCVNDLTAAFKKSPYGVSLLILINPMEIDYDLHTACNYILGLIYSLWREAGIYNVDKVEHCCNEHVELDILFPSNHNIHKGSCGLCFWASGSLIDSF